MTTKAELEDSFDELVEAARAYTEMRSSGNYSIQSVEDAFDRLVAALPPVPEEE